VDRRVDEGNVMYWEVWMFQNILEFFYKGRKVLVASKRCRKGAGECEGLGNCPSNAGGGILKIIFPKRLAKVVFSSLPVLLRSKIRID